MASTILSNEVRQASDLLLKITELMSPETTVRQALTLFTIALAGNAGMDSATLEKKLGMSGAAVSRTIRVLSDVSYDKTPGYGFITLELDPMDNRRRVMRINETGTAAVLKLVSGLKSKK